MGRAVAHIAEVARTAQVAAHIAAEVAHKADLAEAVRRAVGPGVVARKVVHRVGPGVDRTAGLAVVVHTAGLVVVHKVAGVDRREVGPAVVGRAAHRAADLEDREAETY
jgi:hypothetical protein